MSSEYANPESQVSAMESASAAAAAPAQETSTQVISGAATESEADPAANNGSFEEALGVENGGALEAATQTLSASPAAGEASQEQQESQEPMDQLMEQYAAPESAAAGSEVFEGRVIAVNDLGLVVDVGGKFEGLVPAQEFVETGGIHFSPGDLIEVERLAEHKEGYVLLSHVRAHRRMVWARIENSHKEGRTLTGKIVDRIKGGLVVDIGVRAFLPASQLDLRPTHDLEAWKDREIECRVLKLNRKRGNVVVSRRAILEEEQKKQRSALADSLNEGAVVTGKVKNITDYGV
ncbi:MAG: S1 RNA-binding domain-containing protein, partial [Candidatus Acidiferrales bacterium]